jgi:single-strand DNA-binding protein
MAEGLSFMNKVFLIGNLVRDPELNFIASGTAIAKMSIAVNRRFKIGGEWKEEVVFIDLVVWGKQGENCQKYLSKGKKVYVEGRLSQNRWTAQDGTNRSKIEIIAERVQFLTPASSSGSSDYNNKEENSFNGDAGEGSDNAEPFTNDDVPF